MRSQARLAQALRRGYAQSVAQAIRKANGRQAGIWQSGAVSGAQAGAGTGWGMWPMCLSEANAKQMANVSVRGKCKANGREGIHSTAH